MAIDFPNSPTVGDLYTVGGKTWQWNGTFWAGYGTSPDLTISDTPPASPNIGDQWYESDTGRWLIYYDNAWVELTSAAVVSPNANDLQGTTLAPTVVTSSLTSVGTLGSLTVTGTATAGTFSGAGTSLTGTAASLTAGNATKLATARTIDGVSFDGSANVTGVGGMVLVKTQAVGSGVTSVIVTNAFSSTYENYEIIYTGTALAGTDAQFFCQLGSATTNYRTTILYCVNNTTPLATTTNTQPGFPWIGGGSGNSAYAHFKLFEPFAARHTRMETSAYIAWPDAGFGHASGVHAAFTSFTDFTLSATAGTFTGGTIRVYGYRNS